MFMTRLWARQFPLPPAQRPLRAPPAPVEPYPGARSLWRRASARRIGDAVFGVEALVVHVAQRSGTETAMALMQTGRAGWHWIVPARPEPQHAHFIWSAAPEGRSTRHLPRHLTHPAIAGGRPRLNHACLSVLLAADAARPGAAPSAWQVAMLAMLVRQLWAGYPALGLVICRSEIDPATPPSALDWPALARATTEPPTQDLPALVACATPLAMLGRPDRAEPALRTG